ncbi:alpha/beta hydrolase [Candidatus Uhrbacteria bacterium]|nr:alpha/beta hydrolase [Candidatus Uhrbacteria bacterium]
MRHIEVPYHGTILRGTTMGVVDPRVVCIHGASDDGSARFDMLRHHLAKIGIASFAFDFIGAGQTGGDMSTSSLKMGSGSISPSEFVPDPIFFSLKARLGQACAVIDTTTHQAPLAIIGASMGADTAIRLSEKYPTSALILFVPGVYARAAFTAHFNEDFTRIIRQPQSWEDSESFDILSRFHGSLLIVGARNDDVVPCELIDRLLASAGQARHKELTIVHGSDHSILPYLSDHPKEFARVFEKVYHAILE